MTKKEKCSNSQKGRRVIHKGGEEKRVFKSELNDYLAQGWEEGAKSSHCKNNGKAQKGKPKPHGQLSEKQKRDIGNTLKRKIKSGEIIPAFKGKHHSEKTKQEISKKLSGEGNPNYGKHRTDEARRKTSETHKRDKKLSNYLKNRTDEQLRIQLTKAWLTKKLNHTENFSQPEEDLYKKLLEENENKHIYRNYKCDRYPYYCDFYIEEDDLFIELNAHWTHGGHPFDENNEEDLKTLNKWKLKAEKSNFYKTAIEVWTIRDVEKQKCAKENNLNYKVIY